MGEELITEAIELCTGIVSHPQKVTFQSLWFSSPLRGLWILPLGDFCSATSPLLLYRNTMSCLLIPISREILEKFIRLLLKDRLLMESLMQVGKATASAVWRGLFFVAVTHPAADLLSASLLKSQFSLSAHAGCWLPWKQTFHQGKTEKQRSSYAKKLGQVWWMWFTAPQLMYQSRASAGTKPRWAVRKWEQQCPARTRWHLRGKAKEQNAAHSVT